MLIAGTRAGDGTPMVVIGLSEMNLRKLREGMPIHKTPSATGGALNFHLVIEYGETENDIIRRLQDAGFNFTSDPEEHRKRPNPDPNGH